jgi:4-amino-4-deoxy-L-arabinose transferase-like glycosyltransferase
MKPESTARLLHRLLTSDLTLLVVLALAMLLQLLFIRQYGIFRDELYYLACSEHLAWGYVDQPLLSIALLAADRRLLGDSLFAIRLPAVLAGAMAVFLTGYLTREVGGGRFAQRLAALTMLLAPVYLAIDHYYSMNAIDVLLWTAAACVFVRVLKEDSLKRWAALGVILGLGLLNKISVLWLILGLFTALLLTPHRKALTSKDPWLAGALSSHA